MSLAGRALFVLALAALLSGCACLAKAPPLAPGFPAADALIAAVEKANAAVTDARGLGRFRLENARGVLSGRAAWLSVPPARLRIELLSPFGQPVATLAGDGETVALRSFADGSYNSGAPDGSLVTALLGMKVPWEALCPALSFQAPVLSHGRAEVREWRESPSAPPKGWELVLSRCVFGTREIIRFDAGSLAVREASFFSAFGKPLATVIFEGGPAEGGSVLIRSDAKEAASLELWPERFFTNRGWEPSSFALARPSK